MQTAVSHKGVDYQIRTTKSSNMTHASPYADGTPFCGVSTVATIRVWETTTLDAVVECNRCRTALGLKPGVR